MLKDFFKSLSYLLFPKLCIACLSEAALDEELFCIKCHYHLPESKMHLRLENEFTNRLIGVEGIKTGAAHYLYHEGSPVAEMLHMIKYKGRQDIAIILGRAFGKKLIESPLYKNLDYLIPVPLHKNRFRRRGFNQSEALCTGLSDSMGVPVRSDILLRIKDTPTQTKLSKSQRQKNLEEAFSIADFDALQGKHILLVDDVLTTGSTIEACTTELRLHRDLEISVVTLAIRSY